jgi:hypothetical protein
MQLEAVVAHALLRAASALMPTPEDVHTNARATSALETAWLT